MNEGSRSHRAWPKPRGTGALKGLWVCFLPFLVVGACGKCALESVGCIEPAPVSELETKAAEFRAKPPLDIVLGDSPNGLLITGLDAGSVWAKAGCQVGDQIVSLDSVPAGSAWDVEAQIRAAGDAPMNLVLQREGKQLAASVVNSTDAGAR